MARRETTRITIRVAARRAGLSPRTVRRYVRRGVVGEPLIEADLIAEAGTCLGSALELDGTNVYLSYNPKTSAGRKLREWSLNVLDVQEVIRGVLLAEYYFHHSGNFVQ
jgi:hypothetical protein